MSYNDLVKRYFFQPEHIGNLDCTLARTVYCSISDASKSNYFDLYLSCDESGRIIKACFKACGSPYLIASLEWLCSQLEGSFIKVHPELTYLVLVNHLEIPNHLYPIAILVEKGYNNIILAMKKRLNEEKK
ncbi:iron-sulfur cluster assembly scaffold protein [Legionella sp. CNM-1927-20]|uniref:iron-sulfur cluster assembly scaffold protein n=1 Tax=Legionella sp. CNM-1927-20 TaxID=3422221 RepID=UPI00403A898A